MTKIQEILFRHQDVKYGDFTAKLISNISRDEMIGVRAPEFKKIIKEVHEEAEDKIDVFLNKIPHKYQEENILHLQLIGEIKDFDDYIVKLENFLPCIKNWAAAIRSEEYYVNMMTAWLFADVLVKQWDEAVKFLEQNKLDVWTHNKAIQKARESFRITAEQKEYLKGLKRK